MNLFAPLKDFFRSEKPKKTNDDFLLPFNLTSGKWNQLKRLSGNEDFQLYRSTLDALIKLHAEALLASKDDADMHFERGFILGVRKAALLIDEIKRAEIQHNKDKSRLEHGRQPDRFQRVTATFGSPAWRDNDK